MISRSLGRIRKYSLKTDGATKVSANFRVKEFACHDGADTVLVSPETVAILEEVRAYYRRNGHPRATVVINSGYRTPSWNRRIGGALRSEHVIGRAVDFVVRDPGSGIVSPYKVYRDLNSGVILGRPHRGGLGLYRTFTHIDTGTNRRWQG
jgi:uncharacterized protein YcbK (DUF882 family)